MNGPIERPHRLYANTNCYYCHKCRYYVVNDYKTTILQGKSIWRTHPKRDSEFNQLPIGELSETPNWCPYLKIVERRKKLEKINAISSEK